MFRYFILPFNILLWYVIAFDVKLHLKKLLVPVVVLQVIILLVLPNNVILRIGFRFYSSVVQQRLLKELPSNTLLFSAYKYDKYFPLEDVPSYSFLGHRLNHQYTNCFHDQRYRSVLGNMQELLKAIRTKGFEPVVIFPDVDLPDSDIMPNPYQQLNYEVMFTIDMEKEAGALAYFLPEDKKNVYVARVLPESAPFGRDLR